MRLPRTRLAADTLATVAGMMPGPSALDLPGPSRRIRVDPIRIPKPSREPAPAKPAPAPPPEPSEAPARDPEPERRPAREPAPA